MDPLFMSCPASPRTHPCPFARCSEGPPGSANDNHSQLGIAITGFRCLTAVDRRTGAEVFDSAASVLTSPLSARQFLMKICPVHSELGPWQRLHLLLADIVLMAVATLVAVILREDFEVPVDLAGRTLPYIIATTAVASIIFPAAGLYGRRRLARGAHDYARLTCAVTATVVVALAVTFAYNRLDGLARSLPILQLLAAIALSTGARLRSRLSHVVKRRQSAPPVMFQLDASPAAFTVLVAGISKLTEFYLKAVEEFSESVRVAGLLSGKDRHVGRLVYGQRVLGVTGNLEQVLDSLDSHGVRVDCIVLATRFGLLSFQEQEALIHAGRSRGICIKDLGSKLFGETEAPGEDILSRNKGVHSRQGQIPKLHSRIPARALTHQGGRISAALLPQAIAFSGPESPGQHSADAAANNCCHSEL